jgi:hypothetical protein
MFGAQVATQGEPTRLSVWHAPAVNQDPVAGPASAKTAERSPLTQERALTLTATPAVSEVKAGRAVPMKFSIGGDYGLSVTQTGSPTSVRVEFCPTRR